MKIRNAKKEDLKAISKIIKKTYHKNYPGVGEFLYNIYEPIKKINSFKKHFPKEYKNYLIIEKEKDIIGYIHFEKWNKQKISLYNIGILPKYQSKGFGSKLINELKKNTKELRLDVNDKNKKAIKLYKKLGFKIILTDYAMVWKK